MIILLSYLGGKRPGRPVEHPVSTGGTNKYGRKAKRIKCFRWKYGFHSILSYTTVLYCYSFWSFNTSYPITTHSERTQFSVYIIYKHHIMMCIKKAEVKDVLRDGTTFFFCHFNCVERRALAYCLRRNHLKNTFKLI